MILGSRKRTEVLFKSNIPTSRMFSPTSGISDRKQELQTPGFPTQTLLQGDFQHILGDLGLASFKCTCCKLLYCHNRCIFRFREVFWHWTDVFGVYLPELSLLWYKNLFHMDFKNKFLWEVVAQRLQLDVSRSWRGRMWVFAGTFRRETEGKEELFLSETQHSLSWQESASNDPIPPAESSVFIEKQMISSKIRQKSKSLNPTINKPHFKHVLVRGNNLKSSISSRGLESLNIQFLHKNQPPFPLPKCQSTPPVKFKGRKVFSVFCGSPSVLPAGWQWVGQLRALTLCLTAGRASTRVCSPSCRAPSCRDREGWGNQ